MQRLWLVLILALALALSGTAMAAINYSAGTYKGGTPQHLRITLKVSKDARACGAKRYKAPCMLSAEYFARYTCTNPDGMTTKAPPQRTRLGAAAIRNGKINGAFGDDEDLIRFKASFKDRRVTGSFDETYKSQGGFPCKSGLVKFTAKH